jgi:hypothetical protein
MRIGIEARRASKASRSKLFQKSNFQIYINEVYIDLKPAT